MAVGTRLVDLPTVSVNEQTKFAVASPGAGLASAAAVRALVGSSGGGGIGLADPATGQFFASAGARINKLNDRVFVGAATANDGNAWPNPGGADYVTTNIPQGPTLSVAQFAALSTQGTMGIMGGTRTSDAAPSGAQGAIGIMGVAINDGIGDKKQGTFAGYFEAQKKVGAGFTAALEVDTADQSGTATDINPYTFFDGDKSVCIWAAAGGARSGVVNTSAAMAILGNGASYQAGIVFQTGCIATNVAVSLDKNHALQWWGAGATPTFFIQSVATENNYGILSTSAAILIGNSSTAGSTASLAVVHQPSAVDFVQVTGAPTGSNVKVQAAGASANINLSLLPKGASGKLTLGGPAGAISATGGTATALPAAPQFYLIFQFNNDGANYKIPVYNT